MLVEIIPSGYRTEEKDYVRDNVWAPLPSKHLEWLPLSLPTPPPQTSCPTHSTQDSQWVLLSLPTSLPSFLHEPPRGLLMLSWGRCHHPGGVILQRKYSWPSIFARSLHIQGTFKAQLVFYYLVSLFWLLPFGFQQSQREHANQMTLLPRTIIN